MKKWLNDNLMSSLTLVGLISAAIYFGDIKQLFFSSPEMKFKTESHISDGPSPKEEVQARYMDSVNAAHAIASRKKRDSLINEILLEQKKNDSINLLNAVQMSEMQKKQRQQDSLLKTYISIHDQ